MPKTPRKLPCEGGSSVRQTIVTNLEAPRLQGISTKHFTNFQKKRDLYKKKVAEKNRDPEISIIPTSFRASLNDSYLRIFLTAHWIQAETIDEITEQQLQDCIKERASFSPEGYDLCRIDRIVSKVKMDLNIAEAEDRVWSLHHHYLTVLEAAGMPDLPTQKPHISIKHMIKRIQPVQLRQRMKDIVEWRKDEGFGKKDFGSFMRELAKQSKKFEQEQYHSQRPSHESEGDESDQSEEDGSNRNNRNDRGKSGKSGGNGKNKGGRKNRHGKAPKEDRGKNKRDRELPPYLNPKCDKRHFVSDCADTTEEQKKLLKADYYEKKRLRGERFGTGHSDKTGNKPEHGGSVRCVGADAIDAHSALFSATFADGAVESVVMADQ